MTALRTMLFAAAATVAFTGAAAAIEDPVLNAAIDGGRIGEQANGYLGIVDGATPSADERARMEQLNIRRRAVYTQDAQATGATVNDYAGVTACKLLVKNTPNGAFYRDAANTWRRNTSGVALPSYCPSE